MRVSNLRIINVNKKQVVAPKFNFVQRVKVITKNGSADGIISDIMWRYKRRRNYYLIVYATGKRSHKWYFESDFIAHSRANKNPIHQEASQ